MRRALRTGLSRSFSLLSVALPLIAGCTTLDRDVDRTSSVSLTEAEAQATELGERWRAAAPADPSCSAFRLLENSLEAFAARIAIIDRAERTIDIQTYIFADDETGLFIVDRLVSAADRGVRVRILLDDMYAHGVEDGLAAFDAHPNIELRLFNPWTQRGGMFVRGVEFLVSPRLNHRMHNKLFVGDATLAIFGGRNLADEYFDLHADFEFKDLDVVAAGPVATEASRLFDAFWNGEDAIPMTGLHPSPDSEARLASGRARLAEHRQRMAATPYADAVRATPLITELASGSTRWVMAKARVLGDAPDKTTRADDQAWKGGLGGPLSELFDGAEREVLIASPYFVPRRSGTRRLSAMADSGITVLVLTNSLAANDVGLVHAGYAKYRPALVRHGVEIHELRRRITTAAADDDARAFGSANASLHAKTFVLDRERVFIGSLNLDPRSVALNTEIGVLIESPELAQAVAERILHLCQPVHSYRLAIGPLGELLWIGKDADGRDVVLRHEPDTSGWERLSNGVLGLLPIEGQI